MALPDKEQRATLRAGSLILLGFAAFIVLIWLGGYLPGTLGYTFSVIAGALWTPTIMEPTLFILALMTILVLNHHRRHRNGPDFVELETEQPETEQPSSGEQSAPGDELVSDIEEAFAAKEHSKVLCLLREVPPQLLDSERLVAIKLQLAYANSDPNHIRGLSRKLRAINPSHPLLAGRG